MGFRNFFNSISLKSVLFKSELIKWVTQKICLELSCAWNFYLGYRKILQCVISNNYLCGPPLIEDTHKKQTLTFGVSLPMDFPAYLRKLFYFWWQEFFSTFFVNSTSHSCKTILGRIRVKFEWKILVWYQKNKLGAIAECNKLYTNFYLLFYSLHYIVRIPFTCMWWHFS